MNTFAHNLKRIRSLSGLSLSKLAGKAGTNKAVIWSWESGRTSPRPEQIRALADALECSSDDLIRPVDQTTL